MFITTLHFTQTPFLKTIPPKTYYPSKPYNLLFTGDHITTNNIPEAVHNQKASVWKILAKSSDPTEKPSYSNAIVISPHYLLCTAHSVTGNNIKEIEIKENKKDPHIKKGKLVGQYPNLDLAVLELTDKVQNNPVKIATEEPDPDDEALVYIVGSQARKENVIAPALLCGVIDSEDDPNHKEYVFMALESLGPGFSGSALLNEKGELISVLKAHDTNIDPPALYGPHLEDLKLVQNELPKR